MSATSASTSSGVHALVVVDLVGELVVLRNVVRWTDGGWPSIRRSRSASSFFKVGGELVAQLFDILIASLGIDPGDNGAGEVQNLLELFRGNVKQVAQAARGALEVPRCGSREPHSSMWPMRSRRTLAAGNFDAAALAHDALEANALVLAAGAFPVFGGAKDFLAEQAVLFGLERAVVDGFGLLDLAMRPAANILGARERCAGR